MEDTEFDLKDPLGLACFCVETLYKKNASDIQLIHVEDQTIIADYYVLCCGRSTTHVNALSDEVEYQTAQKGVSMARVDGRGTRHMGADGLWPGARAYFYPRAARFL